jgi:hypothetical protein
LLSRFASTRFESTSRAGDLGLADKRVAQDLAIEASIALAVLISSL